MSPESVVLVVGGESNGNGEIARILSDQFRVIEADNMEEAISHATEGVDVVVSEAQAAQVDALGLLRQMKSERPQTPVVVVMNDADVNSAVQAMKLGAADCLVRPVDPGQLRSLVGRLLESNSQSGAGAEVAQKQSIDIPPGTSLEDLERAAVEQALEQHHGNRTHAAKTLGISVRTLQRKLKAWGVPLHTQQAQQANASGGNGPGRGVVYSGQSAAHAAYSTQAH